MGLDFLLHVRLYERGELQWKAFAERPQQYFQEVTFSPACAVHDTRKTCMRRGIPLVCAEQVSI